MTARARVAALATAVVLAAAASAVLSPAGAADDAPLPGQPNEAAAAAYERGERLVKAGKLEQALAAFDEAAKRAPLFHLAHYAAGNALAQLGRKREAETRYRDALAVKPDFANAWNALGVLDLAGGRYERALESLEKALAIDADYTLARYHRGQVLLRLGRAAEAETELRRVLAKDPANADAQVALGGAQLVQGRTKEALAAADALLARVPGQGGARLLRAQVFLADGKLLAAAEEVGKALEGAGDTSRLRPDAAEIAGRVADAACKARTFDAEVRAMESVVLVLPKVAGIRARMGAALLSLFESAPEGSRDERLRERGVTELERALEIDPKHEAARLLLDRWRDE